MATPCRIMITKISPLTRVLLVEYITQYYHVQRIVEVVDGKNANGWRVGPLPVSEFASPKFGLIVKQCPLKQSSHLHVQVIFAERWPIAPMECILKIPYFFNREGFWQFTSRKKNSRPENQTTCSKYPMYYEDYSSCSNLFQD